MSGAREWQVVGDVAGLRVDRDPETGAILLIDAWTRECVYVAGPNVAGLLRVMNTAEQMTALERNARPRR